MTRAVDGEGKSRVTFDWSWKWLDSARLVVCVYSVVPKPDIVLVVHGPQKSTTELIACIPHCIAPKVCTTPTLHCTPKCIEHQGLQPLQAKCMNCNPTKFVE